MNGPTTIKQSAPPQQRIDFGEPDFAGTAEQLPPDSNLGVQRHNVRLRTPEFRSTDPQADVDSVRAELDQLLSRANHVVSSLDTSTVDIHRILMTFARETRLDQQGGLEQAQDTIQTNRRLRDEVQVLVKEIQKELQSLQEEIADLASDLENLNFFEKIGEGIASAFGGGRGKDLETKQANMTLKQGRLKEVEAGLEKAKKLIEHGHQIMESSVQDLKKVVERINRSIQLIKDSKNRETNAVGRS